MPALILGMLAGLYLGNPKFRSMTDKTTSDIVAKGFDFINAQIATPPSGGYEDVEHTSGPPPTAGPN